MAEHRLERLAGVLVDYSTRVQEGDLVSIDTGPAAAPLVRELWRRVLEAGGHPHLRLDVDGAPELLLRDGNDEQVGWMSPLRRAEAERADVRIAIEADVNTRANSRVDPERQAQAERARDPLRRIHFARVSAGDLRHVVTLFPTQAAAQDADMSLADYEDFVFNAGLLDRDDPRAEWETLGRAYARLASWLDERKEIRVVGDGTDLTLGVEGRTWVPCDGRENFPDGEVFTGPVETKVDGTIRFSYPVQLLGQAPRAEWSSSSAAARSFAPRLTKGRRSCARCSRSTRARGARGSSPSGSTRRSPSSPATRSSTRRSAAPFTSRSGPRTRNPAARCSRRSTGISSAISGRGSEVYADGELVYRDGRFLDGLALNREAPGTPGWRPSGEASYYANTCSRRVSQSRSWPSSPSSCSRPLGRRAARLPRSATSFVPGTRSGSSPPSATAATRARASGGFASGTACAGASLRAGEVIYLPAAAGGA